MIKVKKSLFHLMFVSSLFLALGGCAEKMEKEQGEETPEVMAPAQIVPVEQAKGLYDNYSERRLPMIQRYEDSINGYKEKFDVARYITYDYKTIKQYMAYIEQEAKKANVEISGLRIYFSNYPDKPVFDNGDSIQHPRQNSVLLSPSIRKGKRDHLFYIGGTDGESQAILLSDDFGEIQEMGMGHTDGDGTLSHASMLPNLSSANSNNTANSSFYAGSSMTMNRGSGSPPHNQ